MDMDIINIVDIFIISSYCLRYINTTDKITFSHVSKMGTELKI